MSPAYNADLSDERLVAYIDGELSASEQETMAEALSQNAEARERVESLKSGGRPFGEAFDILLDAAPGDKLQAMFADLIAKTNTAGSDERENLDEKVVPLRSRRPSEGVPFWRMAAAAAILALVFTGGLVTGGFFDEPAVTADQKPGWREAAARYVALFSKETLDGMPTDPRQRQSELKRIETALGLELSADRIATPDLSFQGTQLLQLEGKALAQISYLYDGNTPVAFCIIRSANPPAGLAKEMRHGLNIVHWVTGGYGYMVIGDVPDAELARIAENFQKRFS